MSTLKAHFDELAAERLLTALFPDVRDITALAGGEASQAYASSSRGRQMVLRVNHEFSYERDAWACSKLQQTAVPVPRIIRIGQHGALYWAVSERIAGSMLYNLPPAEVGLLVPQIVGILIAIHETPVLSTAGYGQVSEHGVAPCPSWHDFLQSDGKYGGFVDWDRALSRAEDYQRRLIEESWRIGASLLHYCPEERVLQPRRLQSCQHPGR